MNKRIIVRFLLSGLLVGFLTGFSSASLIWLGIFKHEGYIPIIIITYTGMMMLLSFIFRIPNTTEMHDKIFYLGGLLIILSSILLMIFSKQRLMQYIYLPITIIIFIFWVFAIRKELFCVPKYDKD